KRFLSTVLSAMVLPDMENIHLKWKLNNPGTGCGDKGRILTEWLPKIFLLLKTPTKQAYARADTLGNL
ncbi:MAG: hypothetical protein MI892_07765, partial [Desulfobacterales bacterium]|nr:hypothetical protein [Desulfobacterales bacterium]